VVVVERETIDEALWHLGDRGLGWGWFLAQLSALFLPTLAGWEQMTRPGKLLVEKRFSSEWSEYLMGFEQI